MKLTTQSQPLRCAVAAGAGAAGLVWLGPPGADLAAHVYQRAMFIQHGFALWSNYWYAGHYSYITYSLLYYPLAAVVGIKLLAVLTSALAAAAFATLVRTEWPIAGPWPARAFAFVAAASVLTGAFPYALGLALGLLALRAARGHPVRLRRSARTHVCREPSCFRPDRTAPPRGSRCHAAATRSPGGDGDHARRTRRRPVADLP